jgi:hypothetical protein
MRSDDTDATAAHRFDEFTNGRKWLLGFDSVTGNSARNCERVKKIRNLVGIGNLPVKSASN